MTDGLLAWIGKALLKAPIHLYRWTLKPLMGLECRHLPTCSEYGLEAIDTNGPWRGFWLTLSRVLRCNPWGSAGYDPPPDIRALHHPLAPWRYGRWTGRHIGEGRSWITQPAATDTRLRQPACNASGCECGEARAKSDEHLRRET